MSKVKWTISAAILGMCLLLEAQNSMGIQSKLNALTHQGIGFPGAAVGVITAEYDSIWTSGWAHLQEQREFSDSTVLAIGSVTKTFLALALVRAMEWKGIDPHTPIDPWLSQKIRNPNHPEDPITLHHLFTHTSGIRDTELYNQAYVSIVKDPLVLKGKAKDYRREYKRQIQNESRSLKAFVESYLIPKGDLFHQHNFSDHRPGERYEYTNMGAALAALVIESITEMSFDRFTEEYLFKPMGLQETHWEYSDVTLPQLAGYYWHDQVLFPYYELITYPDGGLLTSARDLVQFLTICISGYHGEVSWMSQQSFQFMFGPHFQGGDNPGVFWDNLKEGWRAHGGGDPGIHSMVLIHPEKRLAQFWLTNIYVDRSEPLQKQFRKFFWEELPGWSERP